MYSIGGTKHMSPEMKQIVVEDRMQRGCQPVRVGVVQVAPVFLDARATWDKLSQAIRNATKPPYSANLIAWGGKTNNYHLFQNSDWLLYCVHKKH